MPRDLATVMPRQGGDIRLLSIRDRTARERSAWQTQQTLGTSWAERCHGWPSFQ